MDTSMSSSSASRTDASLLRSLRREMGAPSRPRGPVSTSSNNAGGASSGSTGGGGGAASRRSVGARGGINDLSSVGLLRDAEEGGGGDDYEDDVPDRGGDEYSFEMFDPVWGKPDYPPGHLPSARQFCGVMCCPCLMGRDGCRGTKNLNVWKRISRRAAVITCAVDILMFLLSVIVNGGFQPMWGRNDPNPLLGPSAPTLITLGAKHLVLIQEGQIWRLVTPILLHGGVLHIIMNLTSQFRMGTFLEERWGTKNWLIIYWVGGLGGNLLSCVASPDKVGVGASGAIYAIMGGWLSHITCTWGEEDEFDKFGQAVQAVFFTALGMVLSIAPIVDWAAHVGGLVSGLMLGWWLFHKGGHETRNMLREPLRRRAYRKQGTICMWVLVLIMVVLAYMTFYVTQCHIPVPGRMPQPRSRRIRPHKTG